MLILQAEHGPPQYSVNVNRSHTESPSASTRPFKSVAWTLNFGYSLEPALSWNRSATMPADLALITLYCGARPKKSLRLRPENICNGSIEAAHGKAASACLRAALSQRAAAILGLPSVRHLLLRLSRAWAQCLESDTGEQIAAVWHRWMQKALPWRARRDSNHRPTGSKPRSYEKSMTSTLCYPVIQRLILFEVSSASASASHNESHWVHAGGLGILLGIPERYSCMGGRWRSSHRRTRGLSPRVVIRQGLQTTPQANLGRWNDAAGVPRVELASSRDTVTECDHRQRGQPDQHLPLRLLRGGRSAPDLYARRR